MPMPKLLETHLATLNVRTLDDALRQPPSPASDIAQRIRSRFAALGDVTLEIAEREPVRRIAFDRALAASSRREQT